MLSCFCVVTCSKGTKDLSGASFTRALIKEAEVERFYEDLQDLLELTPKKDVLFITGDWNTKWKTTLEERAIKNKIWINRQAYCSNPTGRAEEKSVS